MTPGARLSAAIEVLDAILAGSPAEQALLRWSRSSRFAGSGDRAAVRDLVFDALRQRDSLAALGGGLTGRGLMLGWVRGQGTDPAALFTGVAHAPQPMTEAEANHLPPPQLPEDLPDWLRPLWHRALPDDGAAVAQAMRARAPVWLRVNTARTDLPSAARVLAAEGLETRPAPQLPTALQVLSNERRLARSAGYLQGLVELQDLSAQLAADALPLARGARVLDYCAGGGGKALALAAREPSARILAHDALPQRMADLPARAARAGARIDVTTRPAGHFDLVVADVPCSGSGTWRRTPDAKWRLTPEALSELQHVQASILDEAAPLVAPSGHLAYMTCSLLSEENGDQIDAFCARQPTFKPVLQRIWTPLDASDGFFLALLQRQT